MPAGEARTQQAIRTREALIVAARELFTRNGFHATATEQIVAHAGVTRGALYHHFSNKDGLFLATFHAVEQDIMARAAEAARGSGWEQLVTAFEFFMQLAATEADVQRIVLIDGPAVLGWNTWRELEHDYALGFISAALTEAIRAGDLAEQPVRPLAHMLLAAMDEGALILAAADEPSASRPEVWGALQRLLEGLRR